MTTTTSHGNTNLPDEILILIISLLDTVSLSRTALVSRHFDDLAEPFLYRRQRIMRGRHASALSVALQTRPERVRWVDSLLVSTKFGDDRGLELLPQHLRTMRSLKKLVLETPDCNKQISANRVPWINLQDRFERVFEASSILAPDTAQRLLPNLQECTLHFVDYRSALYSLTKYPTIFLHPTLKSLTISCTSLDFLDRYPLQLQVNTSLRKSTALEYLHLEECDINALTLAMLLSFPRNLRSLKISEGVRYDGDLMPFGSVRRHGNVHPQHLTEALAHTCAESLETLSLSLGYRHDLNAGSIHQSKYLRLTAMEKLLHLEVSLQTLDLLCSSPDCDHETYRRFPPNLQILKVFGIPFGTVIDSRRQRTSSMVPLPECLIRQKLKHGVPNLNKIIYTYEYYADTDQLDTQLATILNNNLARLSAHRTSEEADLLRHLDDDGNEAIINTRIMIAFINDPRFGTILNNQPGLGNEILRRALADPYLRLRGPNPEFSRIESSKMKLLDKLNDVHLPYHCETNTELQIDLFMMPRGYIPPYLSTEEQPVTIVRWWGSQNPSTAEDYRTALRSRDLDALQRQGSSSGRLMNGDGDLISNMAQGVDLFTYDEADRIDEDEEDEYDIQDDDYDANDHDWIGEHGQEENDEYEDDEESDDTEDSMYVDAADF